MRKKVPKGTNQRSKKRQKTITKKMFKRQKRWENKESDEKWKSPKNATKNDKNSPKEGDKETT